MRLVCSQRLGGDDVAPDRDHSTPQPRNEPITVAIRGHQDIAGLDVAAWSADIKTATPPSLDAGRRRVLVEVGAAIPSHPCEAGEILGRVQAAALLEEQRAVVERGANLGGKLHARDHAGGDPEPPPEDIRLFFEILEMRRLVGELEMPGSGIVAIDLVDADRLLDQGEGIQGGLVAITAAPRVPFEQGGEAELEPGMDHATVAAAGPPTKLVLLEQGDRAAAPRQPRCGHHPGVTSADDNGIDRGRERRDHSFLCPPKFARKPQGGDLTPPKRLFKVARSQGSQVSKDISAGREKDDGRTAGRYAPTFTPCQKAT